jgi:hypothetical protein
MTIVIFPLILAIVGLIVFLAGIRWMWRDFRRKLLQKPKH